MVFPYVFCRMKGLLTLAIALVFPLMACAAPIPVALPAADLAQAPQPASAVHADHGHEGAEPPQLAPVALAEGEKLRVVATTNILGDVVRNVGGDQIELTTLLPVGADPHSYAATPGDLRALSSAHVIFMVGEGIEEALQNVLENRDGDSVLIAVNTGIELMETDEVHADNHDHAHNDDDAHDDDHAHDDDDAHDDDHAHDADDAHDDDHAHDHAHDADHAHHHHDLDPHTWTAVPSVMHWVEIIEHALGELDPANAEVYESAAAVYLAELEALDAEIEAAVAAIPAEQRRLVTDHATFGYFAARYGFEVIGSVIPSFSTLAAPSAQELAALQRQIEAEGVKAIFVGSTVNPSLASQIANDVGVQVVPLYADSLSDPAGPAATYIDMMRYNVTAIVAALQ